MDERQSKFIELMKDEAFAKEFFGQKTPEEAQAFLEKSGVDLSTDEIRATQDIIAKVQSGEISKEQLQKAEDGELSEEELENVAGGTISAALGYSLCVLLIGTCGGLYAVDKAFND